jgi:ADP-heptose:LPS heptosyltransferase
MGLGGYLTWTAAAREIRKIAGSEVKLMPVEQLQNGFLKLVKSEVFKENPDFFMHDGKEYSNNQVVLPLVLNNQNANYCKKDEAHKAHHRKDSHIIEQICECYGIKNPELKCNLYLNQEEKAFADDCYKSLFKEKRFLTIEPFSKDNYTPNREYPFEKWQKIVDSLCDKITIVQIGKKEKTLSNVIDMTGETTFREAVAIIEKSSMFLASESGLVHAATAVDTKSLVVITGYQSEKMIAYPQNINVNISSHGPCGLKIPCPDCKKDAESHNWQDIVKILKDELCL